MISKKSSKIIAIISSTAIITVSGNNLSVSAKHAIKSGQNSGKYIAKAVGIPTGIMGLALICYGFYYLYQCKNNSFSNGSSNTRSPNTSSDNFSLDDSSIVSSPSNNSSDIPIDISPSNDLHPDDSPATSSSLESVSSIPLFRNSFDDLLTKLLNKANLPENIQKEDIPGTKIFEYSNKPSVKITLLGDQQTGKTTFANYLTFDTIPEYEKTIIISNYRTKLNDIKLEIFDAPANYYLNTSYLNHIISHCIMPSNIILLLVDPMDPQHIEKLMNFYNVIKKCIDEQTIAVVINTYKYDNNKWTEDREKVITEIAELDLCVSIYECHKVIKTNLQLNKLFTIK